MSELSITFSQLGLDSRLLNTLSELGIVNPTPIQQQAIPHVLQGKDVLAGAQTGTGKTAAFGLPLIQRFIEQPWQREANSKEIRALVLVPTRELAQQVLDSLQAYAKGTELKIVAVYGGTSMKVQLNHLRGGVDILIATPGRLLDHAHVKSLFLGKVEVLVLDEADRMLDMGFMPDLQRVLRRLSPLRQTLFFSATFDSKIKAVAYRIMRDPIEVQVTPSNSTAETVQQMVYPVDKKRKRELLSYLIGSKNWQQVLVFTKTRQGSDALAEELKLDGIKAVSINGDKSQGARQKALDDFKAGKVRALIATDVAARGLDIAQLEQVVNYDMPFKAEDYVHRIGRTGRAGLAGLAVSLLSHDEQPQLEAIERLLNTRLPQEWLKGFEPSPVVHEENSPRCSAGRSSEKRKLKAQLKIHAQRGKKAR
ncbi:TPA: DEAD/DEAH box helicase [Vibrio cholerae]|uniref:DEAD/DEAH box helicase n=1 Tax=Vibrio cholerae TaxID=666 RepID=UPI0021CEF888|nr:DEAD/DEAH box helicase [Vibrio cholerae]MCU4219043.1 DEAD/DEAH box helicase [Vibrio cholerae]HCZ9575029.1 DEAD/DEAH box helicase [Vibrio cholerae]HCZ9600037.1 DEAD/DEAH box helicase [Vibrio cholerae]HCZ9603077.1 DEAD/DEAH box helicase [Vibrio cholerae]HCZ9636131.1 DEAD/DEAH box helicase [Vibrio cholerae]